MVSLERRLRSRLAHATLGNIRSNPKAAEAWAARIPQVAGTQFETDVDLTIGGKELAAGKYQVSFLAKGEGAWDLHLIDESGTKETVAPPAVTGAFSALSACACSGSRRATCERRRV